MATQPVITGDGARRNLVLALYLGPGSLQRRLHPWSDRRPGRGVAPAPLTVLGASGHRVAPVNRLPPAGPSSCGFPGRGLELRDLPRYGTSDVGATSAGRARRTGSNTARRKAVKRE